MIRNLVTFVLLVYASVCIAEPYSAKVIGITDGDTLKVLTNESQQVKIRLAEIKKYGHPKKLK